MAKGFGWAWIAAAVILPSFAAHAQSRTSRPLSSYLPSTLPQPAPTTRQAPRLPGHEGIYTFGGTVAGVVGGSVAAAPVVVLTKSPTLGKVIEASAAYAGGTIGQRTYRNSGGTYYSAPGSQAMKTSTPYRYQPPSRHHR